jgi:hypothetical protein
VLGICQLSEVEDKLRLVTCRDTMLQMPTDHILSLLIAERDKLTRTIEALQGTPRAATLAKELAPCDQHHAYPEPHCPQTCTVDSCDA